MNCTNCGAPLELLPGEQHYRCPYCTTLYTFSADPPGLRLSDRPVPEFCPLCAIPLVKASLKDTRLAYCTRCHGVLVPSANFRQLVEWLRAELEPAPPQPLDRLHLERAIDCPRCKMRMETHPYAGGGNIVIDNCPGCALNWLDAGELERVGRAPQRRGRRDEWAEWVVPIEGDVPELD